MVTNVCRTIGMFEQNNVGVRLKSNLAEYAESLTESTAKEEVQQFLADTVKILESVDGRMLNTLNVKYH